MEETSNSLLANLRGDANQDAWRTLVSCYTPFLRSILLARGLKLDALDDVVQNVFAVVVRRIPDFERQRVGSFRAWLRSICANCLREQVRKQQKRDAQGGRGSGETKMAQFIQELEDPNSVLSQKWDQEHDTFVLNQLLEQVSDEFQPNTYHAFRRLAVENESVDKVASDLGISVNAAFVARSRVLKRLRSLAAGMIE